MPKSSSICRVTPILADKYLFVEVETQDGRVGLGEAGAWAYIESTATTLQKYGAYLLGKDAELIEYHWEVMRRFGSFSGSISMAALSAIDIALWDLKGQRLDEPIHALLGGPYRSRVRVYGHAKGRTPAQLDESCAALTDERFRGPINAAAPEPATNRDFTRALAAALHRPAIVPVPAIALKLLLGECSTALHPGHAAQRVFLPR